MRVPRTRQDPTRTDKDAHLPPTYVNTESHWWDSSGIYGSTLEKQRRVRTFQDGKLVIENGRLPVDVKTGTAVTGFSENLGSCRIIEMRRPRISRMRPR